MSENTILNELHEARRKILTDWNGDTAAYLNDAQKRLEESGRPIWQGKQRALLKPEIVAESHPKQNDSKPVAAPFQ